MSTDELHKNIEVHPVDVSTAEFVRTVSTAGQFLLPVPDDAADDIGYIVIDSYYYIDTVSWRADDYCHQRCLRRLCM